MSLQRSVFVRLFFALLLAFAQQQAILHALEHDFERIHASAKDVTHGDEAFCTKCLALAHLGHANGPAFPHSAVLSFSPPLVASGATNSATVAPVRSYHSRAPPFFS